MAKYNKVKTRELGLAIMAILLSLYPQYSLSQSRSIDPNIQKKIDDYIQNIYLPEAQLSGMGLTIVQNDGKILYTTGYGLADIAKGITNENSTQFLVASVTKSFTSVVTIKLLHEKFSNLGEAVLDSPIRKLLPEANFTLMDRFRSEQTTFRDLLAHRICLFRDDLQIGADPFNTTEEIAYRTRYNKEVCGFRGDLEYSNQMYVMAGELVGILANKPFEDLMQDLLNEIGMMNTAFVQKTDDFDQMPFRAMPYYVRDNVSYPTNPGLIKRVKLSNAAAGLFVTPNDMAKYIRFLLNLGSIDGKQIVPQDVMKWMRKPSHIWPEYAFKQTDDDAIMNQFGYGLGFILSSYDGWEYVQHGGWIPPYRSLLSLYPTQNLGVFTSVNMGPALVHPFSLHAFIFETMKGNPNATEKAMKMKKSIHAKMESKKRNAENQSKTYYEKIVKKSTMLAAVIGEYGSGSSGELTVSEKFNEERNQTEYYLEYGRWYNGWLQEEVPGVIYKIDFDTDVAQDDYAGGSRESRSCVAFSNETLTFFTPGGIPNVVTGTFKLGVRLDLLPPIPWTPDSCGPETI